jgi:transcription elongation factor
MQIAAGAHHLGDLGVVSHCDDGVAEVLLDTNDSTVKVLVNNLTETADTRTGLETFGRYSLHQLVQLTDNEVGMIVRISAEHAQLLMSSVPLPLSVCIRSALMVHRAGKS